MGKVQILLDLMLILTDGIALIDLRDLLKDFLIGARNKKSAQRIHSEQNWVDRVGMGYIKPYLKRWHREYAFFRWIYLTDLFTLLPQYAALLTVQLLTEEKNNTLIYVLLSVKFLLCLFLRLQQDSTRRTKFRY